MRFRCRADRGLPEHFYIKAPAPVAAEAGATVEIPGKAWLDNIPAMVRHGGDRAYFSPAADFIQMPHPEAFKDGQAYTSTLIHELSHWTGHKSRLDRLEHKRWGDEATLSRNWSRNLAPLSGAQHRPCPGYPRRSRALYCGLAKKLKADPKALMSAAAKASQAIDHLDAYQTAAESRRRHKSGAPPKGGASRYRARKGLAEL